MPVHLSLFLSQYLAQLLYGVIDKGQEYGITNDHTPVETVPDGMDEKVDDVVNQLERICDHVPTVEAQVAADEDTKAI